jgi:ATP-dependent RNA helicase DHX37/DHR1
VDDMMLLMKSMAIDRVQNFPYPSPPALDQLVAAEKTLLALEALEAKPKGSRQPQKFFSMNKAQLDDNTIISELGKTMSHFPLGPRFSKMLALSFHHSLVEFTISLVSALTVQV